MITEIVVMDVVAMLFFSLLTAGLTLFIRKCFQKDMIFRRWYLLLIYFWIKWWRKKDRWKRKFLKPLGLCCYCFNTWLCIPVFFIFVSHNPILLFLFFGISYLWLEMFIKFKF